MRSRSRCARSGIGPGDEVITAANTFYATVGAIAEVGAKPVFVDCDDTFCIDVDQLEQAITPRTKALVPVHLTGDVAEMPRIMEIAKRHKLPVVEDGCQSLLGEYEGRRVGMWGDATAFSMHPLKIINVWGDAGIVVTNDDEMNRHVRLLRNHGLRNRDEMEILGYNSRLDSTQAVVGKWIVRQLPDIVAKRIDNAAYFDAGFRTIPQIRVPVRRAETKQVYLLYILFAQDRDALLKHCIDRGIEAKVHYPIPLHLQDALKYLGYKVGDFPVVGAPLPRGDQLPGRPAFEPRRAGLRDRDRQGILLRKAPMTDFKVPFIDLQQRFIEEKTELMACVERILSQGHLVMTQEVFDFEKRVTEFTGAKHCVSCANGTDALMLGLWALGIGKGDEVITTPISFVASTGSIAHVGATPVYADVREDQNIDPAEIEKKITPRTKAIMPVHWSGRIADMDPILDIAKKHKLFVIEDAAQSMGAYYKGKHGGTFGSIGTFSAHPLKNLNAIGDGGFLVTDDDELAKKIRLYRNHGLQDRDTCVMYGVNSRLDSLNAEVLMYRLGRLNEVIGAAPAQRRALPQEDQGEGSSHPGRQAVREEFLRDDDHAVGAARRIAEVSCRARRAVAGLLRHAAAPASGSEAHGSQARRLPQGRASGGSRAGAAAPPAVDRRAGHVRRRHGERILRRLSMPASAPTVLVVAAHALDEVLGCGGTMALHAAEWLGRARAGPVRRRHRTGRQAPRRRRGSREAPGSPAAAVCRAAGESAATRVPLSDAVGAMERAVNELRPAIVYVTHGGNLHIDHQTAYRAAATALRPVPGSPVAEFYSYEVASSTDWAPPGFGAPFQPQRFVEITSVLDRKLKALELYAFDMRRRASRAVNPRAGKSRAYARGDGGCGGGRSFRGAADNCPQCEPISPLR